MERKYGFDAALAGRRAECDGGEPASGGPGGWVGSRDFFCGQLTGLYYDEGDPPWRWHELANLTDRPEGYQENTVWCEESFIFLVEPEAPAPPQPTGPH
ncbi:MAG: hypothetical protein HY686_06135 [Chloroflexi bacterium]|nr:hypothetical protein [Chloroflexota bacterium]